MVNMDEPKQSEAPAGIGCPWRFLTMTTEVPKIPHGSTWTAELMFPFRGNISILRLLAGYSSNRLNYSRIIRISIRTIREDLARYRIGTADRSIVRSSDVALLRKHLRTPGRPFGPEQRGMTPRRRSSGGVRSLRGRSARRARIATCCLTLHWTALRLRTPLDEPA